MSKEHRVALITGGTRGIGKATVYRLAAEGFAVAFCYQKEDEAAAEIVRDLTAREVHCLAHRCDIADVAAVQGLYTAVRHTLGCVDTLVNNAAQAHYKLFGDESAEELKHCLHVNLLGAMTVTRAFLGDMTAARFGRVINVTSVFGQTGAAMEVAYSAAKAGLIGFTKALAAEVAPSGVTVNAVSPGITDTDMNARLTDKERRDYLDGVPMGRSADPAEIAHAIAFLAHGDSGYITGQVLGVNGGVV